MDVIFETQNGESFTIEIGYFDTVLEIKEKIQKYRNIPISQQTLVFDGKILDDKGDVDSCVILHNSHIFLNVAPLQHHHYHHHHHEINSKPPEKLKLKVDDFISSKKVHLVLNLPSKTHVQTKLSISIDLTDSVEHLKKRLYQCEGFPARQLALYINRNVELQDHRQLREYELNDGSEIDVMIKLPMVPTSPSVANAKSTVNSKKLRVIVVSKCGTKKLPVEVSPLDKVQVLRNELENLQQKVNFELPEEGYFFIYKQNVMEEEESFKWHGVRQGDTIDIFNGSVTGGA